MDSKNNYSAYKRWHKLESEYMDRYPEEVKKYMEPAIEIGRAATGHLFEYDDRTAQKVERHQSKTLAEAGADHFHKHEAEYHDLAVLEAHIDGVRINVEQPLEIGQKIEVRHRSYPDPTEVTPGKGDLTY